MTYNYNNFVVEGAILGPLVLQVQLIFSINNFVRYTLTPLDQHKTVPVK